MSTTEQNLTGYPSIDKPWLKYYKEPWSPDYIPRKSVYRNILEKNQDYLYDTAILFKGFKTSYGEMFKLVDVYARALKANGIGIGDCVNLCVACVPETVCLVLACSKIGALANFINPLFSSEQMIARINDTDAKIMVILDAIFPYTVEAILHIKTQKAVILPATYSLPFVVQKIASLKSKKSPELVEFCKQDKRYVSWKSFIESDKEYSSETEAPYQKDRAVVMVYSSGTTGASKGIVLTNDGINATIAHYNNPDFHYERGQTFLSMIPVWFSTGIVLSVLMPLYLGVSVIPEPVFSKESFSEDMAKYRPNMTLTSTSLWIYAIHSKELASTDLSQMIYPTTGGEKILPDTENDINSFLSEHGCKVKLIKGYGMCELGSTITSTSFVHSKLGSVGYPIRGAEVTAFDMQTNQELPQGNRGEIRVDSPAHMKEYYKNPEATAAFFHTDSNGTVWGCTGDIGYVDEDGDVFILGRATDCYYTEDGTRIYQFDIENVLLQDKAIGDCKVVQSIDKNVVAHIILKPDCNESQETIVDRLNALCTKNLDSYAIPTHYKFRTAFPVHPNGKRDNDTLRKDVEDLISKEK